MAKNESFKQDAEFSYSTTCAKFESTILALFDKAILATHEVPQLEKYVMEQYFWRCASVCFAGVRFHSVTAHLFGENTVWKQCALLVLRLK